MISWWMVAGGLFLIAVALCLLALLIELPLEESSPEPLYLRHRCRHGRTAAEHCSVCDGEWKDEL